MKDLEDMDIVDFFEDIWNIKFLRFQKLLLRHIAKKNGTDKSFAKFLAWHNKEKEYDS